MLHVAFFQQSDGSLEGDELLHAGHVDAIVIRIADLWGRGYDDNLFGLQTVENADDTLLQSRSSYNTVIDDYQVVFLWHEASVGNIIYVGCQVVAGISFCNKGTQLNILDGYLLASDALRKNLFQFFMTRRVTQGLDLLDFKLVQVIVQSFQHSIESYFSCIGNE